MSLKPVLGVRISKFPLSSKIIQCVQHGDTPETHQFHF